MLHFLNINVVSTRFCCALISAGIILFVCGFLFDTYTRIFMVTSLVLANIWTLRFLCYVQYTIILHHAICTIYNTRVRRDLNQHICLQGNARQREWTESVPLDLCLIQTQIAIYFSFKLSVLEDRLTSIPSTLNHAKLVIFYLFGIRNLIKSNIIFALLPTKYIGRHR